MKRLSALLLALVILLSFPGTARAEISTGSSVVRNVIRLSRAGEPVEETRENELILETLYKAEGVGYAMTADWLTLRIDEIYIAGITVTNKDFLKYHPGAFVYAPYTFIRLGFTLENGSSKSTVTIPADWIALVSNCGEIVGMTFGSPAGTDMPSYTIAPGASESGYMFFRLVNTWPDLEFFAVLFRDEPGVLTNPCGFCVELLPDESAEESAGPRGVAFNGGESTGADYVLNLHTMKFHYPDCSSVDNIAADNRQDYTGTREDLIARGFTPCGNCKP